MAARAFITGLAGLSITASERSFLRDTQPWGLIIFKRKTSTPDQVAELTQSFRDCVGWQAPVFVDQEVDASNGLDHHTGLCIRQERVMGRFTTAIRHPALPQPGLRDI